MAKKRYDNNYVSVTEVLGVLRKIGLENWFKNNTAAFCDAKSAKGKLIGTQIHQVIENYILGRPAQITTEYPDEVTNALNSFMLFKKEHPEIEMKFAETKMTSEKWQFNGTMDVGMVEVGNIITGDWKGSECKKKKVKLMGKMVETDEFNLKPKIYEEAKYQVSAYNFARNEVFGTNVESGLIIALAKDTVAFAIHKMGKNEMESHFYDAFLPCLKICYHQKRVF